MCKRLVLLLAISLCLASVASAGVVIFAREIPTNTAYVNNGASGRANYAYRDYTDQGYYMIPGDDFSLPYDTVIDSISVWGVANTSVAAGGTANPADEFDQLNLYLGPAGGDLTWITDTYTSTAVRYGGTQDFLSQDNPASGTTFPLYQVTFTGLNFAVAANTPIGFAVYGIPIDPAHNFALHATVASLAAASGAVPFDGPDSQVRYYYYNGGVYPDPEFTFNGFLDTYRADANVVVTGVVPEPSTYGLFGFGIGAILYFRRRRA